MNFLCPACRTALPRTTGGIVPCTACGVEVDLTRLDTAPGTSALRPDVDLEGETLGSYRLGRRLGAGGMGIVYEAEGPSGRCAVKVLGALLASDPALRARFRREAAALRAITHPGVVRVLEDGEERGFSWYAMELVEGTDLRTRLAKGALGGDAVERLARSLLAALAEVHARGFVHRDVKPANVLLAPDGAPKLCDFGIARYDGATTLTESAAILGSLRYMSPEQRLGRAGPPADLYALGVTLHEALAGGVPDETPLPSDVPRRLRRLVEALGSLKAADRPASAGAALLLLDRPLVPRLAVAASLVVLLGASLAFALSRPAPPPVAAAPLEKAARPRPPVVEAPQAGQAPPQPQGKLEPLFDNPEPQVATPSPTKAEVTKEPPRPTTQAFDRSDAFSGKLSRPPGLGTRGTGAESKASTDRLARTKKSLDAKPPPQKPDFAPNEDAKKLRATPAR